MERVIGGEGRRVAWPLAPLLLFGTFALVFASLAVLASLALASSAHAGAKIKESWADPQFGKMKFKNVLAIVCGIVTGKQLGNSMRAMLLGMCLANLALEIGRAHV